MLQGDAIAYNGQGEPSIVRHVDAGTGIARTIVRNDDGSRRVFGNDEVRSLTDSTPDHATKWASELTNHQLRGLVHEIGQRLLRDSQLYHSRVKDLDRLGETLNYQYFGLSVGVPDKDLDNAYRNLARKMHPDKNGGTEEANRRFQHMKSRYEALKKKRSEAVRDDKSGDKDAAAEKGEEGAEGEEEGDGDLADKKKDKSSTSIEYDPGNKESMVATVTRMVKQLKNVEIQMQVLLKELHKAQQQMPSTSPGT